MDFLNNSGKESEWNEAQYKSKRLHDIQELINYFKMNPIGTTGGRFNYYWLEKNIEALYGEGQSKYGDTEKKSVNKIKFRVQKVLRFMPPHVIYRRDRISGSDQSCIFNQKNFDILMDVLDKFEMIVKDLNDKHGLTTKNKEEDEDEL